MAYLCVHSPHSGDDIHGKNNGTQDGELAQNIVGLLCTLIHSDVDLSKVVTVCSRKKTRRC